MNEKQHSLGNEIRAFVMALEKLAEESRAFSVIGPIITQTCDHLLLRARYSDQLQREHSEAVKRENDEEAKRREIGLRRLGAEYDAEAGKS